MLDLLRKVKSDKRTLEADIGSREEQIKALKAQIEEERAKHEDMLEKDKREKARLKKEIEEVKKKLNKGYDELNEENDSEEESKSHSKEQDKHQVEEEPLSYRNKEEAGESSGKDHLEVQHEGGRADSKPVNDRREGANYDIEGPKAESKEKTDKEESEKKKKAAEAEKERAVEEEKQKKLLKEEEEERKRAEEAKRKAKEEEESNAKKEQSRQKLIEDSIQKEKRKQEIKKELRLIFMAGKIPYQDLESELVDRRELSDGKVSLDYLKMRLSREPLSIYDEKKLEFIVNLVKAESGENNTTYSIQEATHPIKTLVGTYKLMTDGETGTRLSSLSKVTTFNGRSTSQGKWRHYRSLLLRKQATRKARRSTPAATLS